MDGIARIKEEFIIQRSERSLNKDKEVKNQEEKDNQIPVIIADKEADKVENGKDDQIKPHKEVTQGKRKKKEKGQNKKRPRTVPLEQIADRLCPSLSRGTTSCQKQDQCSFSHDIAEYLKKKPDDIGDDCVNFRLKGKCNFGLECRFAQCHITSDLRNMVDEKCVEKVSREPPTVMNVLNKELQVKLRKKQFSFPKANEYLKELNKGGSFDVNNETLIDALNPRAVCHGENGNAYSDSNIRPNSREIKTIDFSDKLYLAPLTTVGNLPFRRICKRLGADVTCSEMAMVTNLLQGQQSEWALLKRHHTEDIFGVQVCGSFPDTMSRCAEMLNREVEMDFIDINIGCPIDLVFKKGGGCALMGRMKKFEQIVKGMVQVSDVPITVKMRTGIYEKNWTAHNVIPRIRDWGASLVTLHGRSREQRYTRTADWDYINQCAAAAKPMPLFGNGDILSFEDANQRRQATGVSGLMIARGALIKPWIFTEIKEQRHWDISSQERFDILKDYVDFGLEHWGSDNKGVENTRRFLLEWLSFLHRYIPVGILEVVPQKINQRPAPFFGRNELETLMASSNCSDWVKISEMLLGPVPSNFSFLPKHKANSYS